MRFVAIIAVVACMLAVVPPTGAQSGPADECAGSNVTTKFCQRVAVNHADPMPGSLPYYTTYYVFFATAACTSPNTVTSSDCNPRAASGSGTPLPTGSKVPALGSFPLVFYESNGAPGLQRESVVVSGHLKPADFTMLA